MGKLIEIGLCVLAGGAIVVGAYQAGKYAERAWWRQELASRNQEVKTTMSKLGEEAQDLDEQLLKIIEADRGKLESAEATIASINTRPAAPADPGSVCLPVRAACLQR